MVILSVINTSIDVFNHSTVISFSFILHNAKLEAITFYYLFVHKPEKTTFGLKGEFFIIDAI